MGFWIFWTVVLLVSAYAFRAGGREECQVAAILVAAYFATFLIYTLGNPNWLTPQYGILASDSLAALLLLHIALRSKRFWPLPIVAFQILPVLTMLVSDLGENLVSYALGVAQGAWSYLQLLILVIATNRSRKRMQN